MTKIVYFNIPSVGHVNPTIPVIKELVEAGQNVLCINTETHRKKIEDTGAIFISYPDSEGMEKYMENSIASGNLIANMYDLIKLSYRLYFFSVAIVKQEKPDIVINDSLASWGKIAAKAEKIPALCLITTFVVNSKTLNMPIRSLLDLAGKLLFYFPQYCLFALFMKFKTNSFPVALTNAGMATGMENIVFTSSDFQPQSIKLGKHFHFVGPTFLNRKETDTFDFSLVKSTPLIYISLGTLIRNPAFFDRCFEAFANHEGTFILSIGKHFAKSDLTNIPANFIVETSFPQLEILKRADVFISHAGLNSTHESLVSGVPMLLIPQQMEQAIVAREVEKKGAGIALQTAPPYGQVSAAQLLNALDTILNTPSYQPNAKKAGETLLQAGGVARTVSLIVDFTKQCVARNS
jgi:MGT family glycosyltransferase